MANACVCSQGLGNTGTVACLGDVKNTKKIFIVPTFDSTGAKNSFLISDTIDQAWLDARINEADLTKRWRPVSDLENVTDTIADSTFETAASGRKAFIKEGVRSFLAEIWGADKANSEYLGILKGMHCTDMSVYLLDTNNNLIGVVPATEDGYLYPIRIDKNSWEAKLIKATDTTQQKITLSFDFHPSERDELMRYISEAEYTADFVGADGLLDIFVTYTSTGQTSMVAKLYARFGTAKTKEPMKGLLAADFALFNVTDSAAVPIITSTENPDGTYTLTYASQTVSDVLRLTPSKDGYDFSAVVAATSTVI
jgi:hypothetical protein